MRKFWTCFVEGTNGGNHYQHPTFQSAKQEADRLANMPSNDGKYVYVLECLGASIVHKVNWEQAEL